MKGISKKVFIGLLAALFIVAAFTGTDVFAKVKHNVTFIYGLKSVTVQVPHGGNAAVPTDTFVPGYQFISWVGSAANVTEDRVILGAYANNTPAQPAAASTALYTKKFSNVKSAPWPEWWSTLNLPKGVPGKTCAVHWYNEWNGELWKTDIVPYGSSLATPPDPCLAGYDFSGWEGDWTNVTEDRAIGATYYIKHRIRFYDDKGDLIDVKYVRDGEGDWVDPPERDKKKFVHYVRDDGGGTYSGGGVHYDIDVYAEYEDA